MDREPTPVRINAWRPFLSTATALVERIAHDMDAAGVLPLAWYDVLVELAQAPEGRLRMSDLAEAVVLSKSSLSRLVDQLEGAGLLSRQPVPGDRRGAFAALTDAGRAAVERAWPVYSRSIEQHFARHLSDAESDLLIAALGRISRALAGGSSSLDRRGAEDTERNLSC
jgi:DNA-binding MarR family transcriptional regulator